MILNEDELNEYLRQNMKWLKFQGEMKAKLLSLLPTNDGPDILFYVKDETDPLNWPSFLLHQCKHSCNCYTLQNMGTALINCEKCNKSFWRHQFYHLPCFSPIEKYGGISYPCFFHVPE
jgi:hypothetical protein